MTASRPVASIVIPTFHSKKTLPRLSAALLAQETKHPYEILIVDNSADDTADHAHQLLPAAKVERITGRVTPGEARNVGIANARGDFVLFIDSDCVPAPRWIESAVTALVETRAAGVGGPVENANAESLVAWAEYYCEFSEFHERVPAHTRMRFVPTCNAGYRTDLLREAGGFNAEATSEDVAIADEIRRLGGNIVFVPEMSIGHLNRTTWGAFLRNQKKLGIGFARHRMQSRDAPGSWLVRAVWPLVGLPLIRFPRRAAQAFRARRFGRFLLVSPIVFLGLCAHALGAIQGRFRP